MKVTVQKALEQVHKKSGGHCGTTLVGIIGATGKNVIDVKKIINDLYKKGHVTVHDGAQGKLIKYKK